MSENHCLVALFLAAGGAVGQTQVEVTYLAPFFFKIPHQLVDHRAHLEGRRLGDHRVECALQLAAGAFSLSSRQSARFPAG